MLTAVFVAQLIIGLVIYGRGWWHAAFAPGTEEEPNLKQLYIVLRGYTVNLSALANGGLGLALIAVAIVGLVIL